MCKLQYSFVSGLVVAIRGAAAPLAVHTRRCVHVGRDSGAPPPPPPIWKRKKKLFCIEGINSRHLVVARN